MHYDLLDTPVGRLLIACNADGAVRWVLFDEGRLGNERGPEWTRNPRAVAPARKQLAEYFVGKRSVFDISLCLPGTDFQRTVWNELLKIPYGETCSYGSLARRIGRPRASRAVGAANGRNPVSIIVPCHRVVGSTGRLTGYGGGLGVKRALLDLERRAP